MNKNNFSVLLSVYVKENPLNLKIALESIYHNQTLKPTEIVLVQDGPLTDELYKEIESFSNVAPLKSVVLDKNMGLGHALQVGATHCSYDIIARMDTDDVARPERFEKQIKFLIDNPEVDVVGANIEEFNESPGDLNQFKINPETHEELVNKITLKSPFNHPTIMMRKEALFKAGNYNGDLLLFEDYSLFLRMWLCGLKFHNLQEVFLDFRIGSGIETIKRRSGKHYIEKEMRFIKYAEEIGAFNKFEALRYKSLRLPVRVMPTKIVLFIYNNFLRKKNK